MRYVENLIPEKSKVLRNYFKGNLYYSHQSNKLVSILLWILGLFFFFSALASIKHPLLTLVFGIIGFILIPAGHYWIEKTLKFHLTKKIKAVLCIVLLIVAMPLTGYYKEIDTQETLQQKLITEQDYREQVEAEKIEKKRKDSFNFYYQISRTLNKENQSEEALLKLNYAMSFAASQADKDFVNRQQVGILSNKAIKLVKSGKFKEALSELTDLIAIDANNSELLYNRAICYSKIRKIQEAVNDCNVAIKHGNIDAQKLYDKINPIRKRVVYYETLCCDGSTSDSKGQGACSHHGGVCNWNSPVYEEYRKYN